MPIQVGALLSRELANPYTRIDAPGVEKLVSDLWHDDELLARGERDVALVEQVVDVRREEQTVRAVETLGIRRVSPWFDVTGPLGAWAH